MRVWISGLKKGQYLVGEIMLIGALHTRWSSICRFGVIVRRFGIVIVRRGFGAAATHLGSNYQWNALNDSVVFSVLKG